jgi:ribonuclease J
MVSLAFYGGVNEIGGNKILVEDRDTKIFLDFGMSFKRRGMFFEEFLTPRTANGIGDFLATGLLPDLKGVYRSDLLQHQGRKPEECTIDAVFLSHGHADHANYISFLHEDIPVYCGETTKLLLEAVQEQSSRDIESEILDFKKRPIHNNERRNEPIKRTIETFRTGDKVKIGDIEVEPVHVDHSVPGAYGFIVHTSEGAIAYTGDLRLHGNRPELTRDFVEKAQENRPIALIIEGTRIKEKKDRSSEALVHKKALKITKKAKSLVIADFNFKDVDRFRTFYEIAKETDRQLVVSFKHACFLDRYSQDRKLGVCDCQGENICLIKPKMKTGTYILEDYSDKYIKERLDYDNVVTAEEIARRQDKYLIVLNYWYMHTLIDIKPKPGSTYIRSLSEPFNEEMELSDERLNNWLALFDLKREHAHCSGHAPGNDLKEIVKEIKPKELFPVHTDYPERFRDFKPHTVRIKNGKRYKI